MQRVFSLVFILRLLFQPKSGFKELAKLKPSPISVFFRATLWFGLLPPLFAYYGASNYGWRLGTVKPLILQNQNLLNISLAYFFALLIGFVSAAIVSRWMAVTYEARRSFGIHFSMITVVGAPLILGSIVHLYPDVFINILVLIPAILWSMYLLYSGLPIVLHTTPERGMLMSSSLIGYLLVAFVSLLGITVFMWINGIGPLMGI